MQTFAYFAFFISGFFLISPCVSLAKSFQNSYVSFEIPDSWSCTQDQTEWVCTPSTSPQSRDALIIVSAKESGPEDNLEAYKSYLQRPKNLKTSQGAPTPSKVVQVKLKNIHDQKWMEGLHYSSEVEGFYTLYLATVKEGLAVLVSLSADQKQAARYNPDFSKVVQSIRLTASQALLSALKGSSREVAPESLGIPQSLPESPESLEGPNSKTKLVWYILGLAALILLYLAFTTFGPGKKKKRKK